MTALALFVPVGLAAALLAAGLGLAVYSRRVARRVRAGFPPAGTITEVPGGAIHWIGRGGGPPVVLIHGLSGNLHNFTYALVDRLSADFRVIALDRPGCGHSRRDSDAGAELAEQARMIADFLEAEGVERPVIAGHSLGGAVGLALALDHPRRVGALALLAPLARAIDEPAPLFRPLDIASPALRRLVSETVAVPAAIRGGEAALAAVFAPEPAPEDFGERGGGLLGLRPQAFYAASTDLLAAERGMPLIDSRYGEIACPVGVLYGEADRVLEAESHIARLDSQIPRLVVERIPGAGHMPIVTRVEETAAFIRGMAGRV